MQDTILDLLLLFCSAFLAATIFPAQSEAVLAGMHLSGIYNTGLLLAIATLGNVLGSCINWLLGRYIATFGHKKWFPPNATQFHRASATYQRFGSWTLLFAWVPVIGDPLTLAAGFFKVHFMVFVALVTLGKAARYIAILSAI